MAVDIRRVLCGVYRPEIGQLRSVPKAAHSIAKKMFIKEAAEGSI